MKRIRTMVLRTVLAICASGWADKASGEEVQKVSVIYSQGLDALKEGEADLAAECFREVLRLQPDHGNARYQLLSLAQKKPKLAAKVLERKLAQVRIPKLNFDDTSFEDAVEALGIMVSEATEGEFEPNFIVQDPHRQFEGRTVTMKLGAVPASVALEYILNSVDAKVRYDEFAIVLMPLGPPPKKETGEDPEPAPDLDAE